MPPDHQGHSRCLQESLLVAGISFPVLGVCVLLSVTVPRDTALRKSLGWFGPEGTFLATSGAGTAVLQDRTGAGWEAESSCQMQSHCNEK